MTHRILLAADDSVLVSRLGDQLRADGLTLDWTAERRPAFAKLRSEPFDLMIVNASLRAGAMALVRELRTAGIRVPILMLTREGHAGEGVMALQLGADDYVEHPLDGRVLLAKMHALLRRWCDPRWAALPEYRFDSIAVDFVNGTVLRNRTLLTLSAKELHLLRYLISRRGSVLPREELLSAVWGYGAAVTRTVDVHIAALRQKIEKKPHEPRYIRTVRGVGYVFHD